MSEPARDTDRREFQIFAKPAGAVCNLDCHYCYYLEKQRLYPNVHAFRMDDNLLENFIKQQMELSTSDIVRFSWHGGEPTTLGLDYFRKIVRIQHRHTSAGKRVVNGLVTNGTLLNEEWCEFLASEGFAVGLSLDGPEELHDQYRVSKGGKPTHEQVMRGFKLLKQQRVPCDVLCVVHDRNVRAAREVYGFFKEIGATFVGFLPLVQRFEDRPGGVSESSVPAEEYGAFLCTIFDEWVRHDIGRILIQIFDEAARPVRGLEHALCIFRETCGDIPVLEYNGDFYSCDHFVDVQHLLGNIREDTLSDLLRSSAHEAFGNHKQNSLPGYCLECDVLPMCNGGCPKDRFIRAPDGEPGLNYLCNGLKRFFSHCQPMFEKLVPLWKAGAEPEQLMSAARGEGRVAASQLGRNQPCPCGSGRKYKRCCLGTKDQI